MAAALLSIFVQFFRGQAGLCFVLLPSVGDPLSLQRKASVKRTGNRKPVIISGPISIEEGALRLLACRAGSAKTVFGEIAQSRAQQMFGRCAFAKARRSVMNSRKVIIICRSRLEVVRSVQ
jgi:hypothetical protein